MAMNPTVADDLLSLRALRDPARRVPLRPPLGRGQRGLRRTSASTRTGSPTPTGMLRVMRDRGWRVQVWFSEWALDERGAEAERGGVAGVGQPEGDRPDRPRRGGRGSATTSSTFLRGPEGRLVDGFFLDRTDEIVPSEATDVYADGRNGRQVHNAYPVLMQGVAARRPRVPSGATAGGSSPGRRTRDAGTWRCRGAATPAAARASSSPRRPTPGRRPTSGCAACSISVQRAAFMGLPCTGGPTSAATPSSPTGRSSPAGSRSARCPRSCASTARGPRRRGTCPPSRRFDAEVLDIYRRYVRFHHALAPYLRAGRGGRPGRGCRWPGRSSTSSPTTPRAGDLWDEWLLGPRPAGGAGLAVGRTGQRDVYLPAGPVGRPLGPDAGGGRPRRPPGRARPARPGADVRQAWVAAAGSAGAVAVPHVVRARTASMMAAASSSTVFRARRRSRTPTITGGKTM